MNSLIIVAVSLLFAAEQAPRPPQAPQGRTDPYVGAKPLPKKTTCPCKCPCAKGKRCTCGEYCRCPKGKCPGKPAKKHHVPRASISFTRCAAGQ